MLDILEAEIGTLRAKEQVDRAQDGPTLTFTVPRADSISPDALRTLMESAGLLAEDFAFVFSLNRGTVDNWLKGKASVPGWVAPSLRIFDQLPPSARRRILNRPKPQAVSGGNQSRQHPFRLEEL